MNSLNIEPHDLQVIDNLGTLLIDLKRYEDAIRYYNKGLQINSNIPSLWYSKGYALAKLGDMEDAIKSFDRELSLEPNNIDALNSRGFHSCYSF